EGAVGHVPDHVAFRAHLGERLAGAHHGTRIRRLQPALEVLRGGRSRQPARDVLERLVRGGREPGVSTWNADERDWHRRRTPSISNGRASYVVLVNWTMTRIGHP